MHGSARRSPRRGTAVYLPLHTGSLQHTDIHMRHLATSPLERCSEGCGGSLYTPLHTQTHTFCWLGALASGHPKAKSLPWYRPSGMLSGHAYVTPYHHPLLIPWCPRPTSVGGGTLDLPLLGCAREYVLDVQRPHIAWRRTLRSFISMYMLLYW